MNEIREFMIMTEFNNFYSKTCTHTYLLFHFLYTEFMLKRLTYYKSIKPTCWALSGQKLHVVLLLSELFKIKFLLVCCTPNAHGTGLTPKGTILLSIQI